MKRRRIILIASLVIAALVYVVRTQPESTDLSQFSTLNEKYDVTIYRDQWGVPHVYGKTDADTAFGLAYAHAEDDFATIQGVLAAARGNLAMHLGKKGAGNDFMVGLLQHRKFIDEKYESDISPETRRICEGYADGINYYVSQNPENAWSSLYPFEGKDIAAGFVHKVPLFFGFEKTLGKLFKAESRDELENLLRSKMSLHSHTNNHMVGSNTLAVAPSRSNDGSTFLAVNSHQPWIGPVAWYEANLHSEEGWNMTGALFPGAPMILHGHNRHLGWAHTVNHADLHDVYVLDTDPDNSSRYRVDDQWHTLKERTIPIKVRLWGPLYITVKKKAYDSIFGPTIQLNHGTYALRFASMGDVRQVEQWYRMNRATTLEEWKRAMSMQAVPCFNSGYADRQGNIFYLYNARIPRRNADYNWKYLVPGNTKETLWQDYIPFETLPQVLNPSSGFIQNCNSTPFQTTTGEENPDPSVYPEWTGIEHEMTNRALRALELFGSDPSITWKEFIDYKYDMGFSEKSRMADYLRQLQSFDAMPEELQEAHDIVTSWDLDASPSNTHTALAMLTLGEWYDEKKETIERDEYLKKLQWAQQQIREHHKSLSIPWKEMNRIVRGETNRGMGGAADTLHSVHSKLQEDGTFHGHTGDSYVLLVRWNPDGTFYSESIHQFGSATQDASSPHYADQLPLFIQRKRKEVIFHREAIAAQAERTYSP